LIKFENVDKIILSQSDHEGLSTIKEENEINDKMTFYNNTHKSVLDKIN
jgi:hypothetical protein